MRRALMYFSCLFVVASVEMAVAITITPVGPFPSGPGSDFRADSVAVVDLDEDGNPDIAVTNFGPSSQPPFGNTSVLWGDGAAGFSPPQILGEGIATAIAAGDLDSDGHIDLVVIQNGITVYWGNGTRTPTDQQTITGDAAYGLALADLDGNGRPDIVVGSDQLVVFFNDGARHFHSATFSGEPSGNIAAVAQLDGRNGLDLVVTSFWGSAISFLFGDGVGSFAPPVSLAVSGMPSGAAVGEFTGDAHVDVAYARKSCFVDSDYACPPQSGVDGLSILRGDGQGGFADWALLATDQGPTGVSTGDLNGDGRDDLAVTNFNGNTVSVFLGQSSGGFSSLPPVPVDRGPLGVVVADVNHDGCPDIVTANWRGASVSVLLVSGCTTVPSATPTTTPSPTPTETATPTPLGIRGSHENPAHDRSDCQVEWWVTNPNRPLDRYGLPKREQICVDGDASCDFKSAEPGICEFQVVVCLNNHDPGLPACIPSGITSVNVLAPHPERARNGSLRAILATDLATLQAALLHLLDPSNPTAGYVNAPPLAASQQDFCSAPFAIDVPVDVRLTGTSRRSVALLTRSTDNRLPAPRRNLSNLKLTCISRPLP